MRISPPAMVGWTVNQSWIFLALSRLLRKSQPRTGMSPRMGTLDSDDEFLGLVEAADGDELLVCDGYLGLGFAGSDDGVDDAVDAGVGVADDLANDGEDGEGHGVLAGDHGSHVELDADVTELGVDLKPRGDEFRLLEGDLLAGEDTSGLADGDAHLGLADEVGVSVVSEELEDDVNARVVGVGGREEVEDAALVGLAAHERVEELLSVELGFEHIEEVAAAVVPGRH